MSCIGSIRNCFTLTPEKKINSLDSKILSKINDKLINNRTALQREDIKTFHTNFKNVFINCSQSELKFLKEILLSIQEKNKTLTFSKNSLTAFDTPSIENMELKNILEAQATGENFWKIINLISLHRPEKTCYLFPRINEPTDTLNSLIK